MGMLAFAIKLLGLLICGFADDVLALVEKEQKPFILVENLDKPWTFRRSN